MQDIMGWMEKKKKHGREMDKTHDGSRKEIEENNYEDKERKKRRQQRKKRYRKEEQKS